MNYTFNNCMKPYVFNTDSCWSGNTKLINYGDFNSFQLREIILIDNTEHNKSISGIKRLFCKPLPSRLILRYQLHDFMSIEEKDILVDLVMNFLNED